jgi:hypothetical protein
MSLFRQGKKEQARKVAIAAAATMKPLLADEQSPLAGRADDDLIVWLAYQGRVEVTIRRPSKRISPGDFVPGGAFLGDGPGPQL